MNSANESTPTRLYIWSGQALAFGVPANTGLHLHHALQISIGLDAEFRMRSSNGADWREHRALLVCADQPHQFEDAAASTVSVYLDPESSAARRICRKLSATGFCQLDFNRIEPLLAELPQHQQKDLTCEKAGEWMRDLFEVLTEPQEPPPKMDARIRRGLKMLRETPGHLISAAAVADAVGLSSGRFAHLFRAQVGLPVRRYLLWMRLREAVKLLSNNNSLTEAAHGAGFADSAHLTRTFRKMFGIAPSEIFQNSQFVQVNFCGD
jgi:AraC family transcriptional regulator